MLTQTLQNSKCFALFKLPRWVMGCVDTGRDSNVKLTTILSTSTHMFQQRRERLIVRWYVCLLGNVLSACPCWKFLLSISTWNFSNILVRIVFELSRWLSWFCSSVMSTICAECAWMDFLISVQGDIMLHFNKYLKSFKTRYAMSYILEAGLWLVHVQCDWSPQRWIPITNKNDI